MREYRDDLASAHQRIAQLEGTLGIRHAPPRDGNGLREAGWIGGTVAGILGVGALLAIALVFFAFYRQPHQRENALHPAVAADVPRVSVSYYMQQGLPVRADIDGDGIKDFVALFWGGDSDWPMYVGALDGKTFETRWSAGPYPGQWNGTRTHLARVGNTVVVTDSQEFVHVLSLANGGELGSTKVDDGVSELCALGGSSSGRALVRVGDGFHELKTFDVETRTLAAAPPDARCTPRRAPCEEGTRRKMPSDESCVLYGPAPTLPRSVYEVFGLGSRRVGIEAPGEGGHEPHLIGWERGAKSIVWRVDTVTVAGDRLHFGTPHYDADAGRFATLYQSKAGPFRLVVRDMATGAELWKASVRRSSEGSYVGGFGIEENDVLVAIDHGLAVFDARTGAERQDLSWISVPARHAP